MASMRIASLLRARWRHLPGRERVTTTADGQILLILDVLFAGARNRMPLPNTTQSTTTAQAA
jgi:hypothetical protein